MVKKVETLGDENQTVGNTKTLCDKVKLSETKRTNQLKSWFFTFNNYTEDDILLLEKTFKEICFKYIFEKEIGTICKTPHLQGVIFLKKAMRWSEFNLPNKINWSKVINNEKAIKYCQKDYQSNGNQIFYHGLTIKKRLLLENMDRPFQLKIQEIINSKPNNRSIYWFYEGNGNVGKSQTVKYHVVKNNVIFIDEGKKVDIMNTTLTMYNENNPMEIFMFDIPRQNKNKISWKSIESIKNGLIYSPKYEGGYCAFNSPHVIIFSNFLPEISEHTISKDRIICYEILENFEIKEIIFETLE